MNVFLINEHYEIRRPRIYRIVYSVLSVIIVDFLIWLAFWLIFSMFSEDPNMIAITVILLPIVGYLSILGVRHALSIRNKVNIIVDGDKITFSTGMIKKTHRFWDIKGTDYMENGNPYGLYICFSRFEYYGLFLHDVNANRLSDRLEKLKFVRKTEVFYEPVKSTRFGKA